MTKKSTQEIAIGGAKSARTLDSIHSLLDEFSVEVLEAVLGILKAQQEQRRKGDDHPD